MFRRATHGPHSDFRASLERPASATCRLSSLAALAIALIAATAPAAHAGGPALANVGLTPGWITFGQAVPQGVAPTALKIGTLDTQTDVKTAWPDGSIRFAIVTANVPVAGNYPVTPSANAGGTFVPAMPTASVNLAMGGVVFTASLPAAPPADRWLSGPLVYEGRSVVAPISSANGSAHPFLRVIFDTRVYVSGDGRIDVTVENVLDQVGATTVTYDATIMVNGSVAFMKSAVEHFYLTRWRKVFDFGSSARGIVTPDTTPFNISRALPPYLPLVGTQVDTIPSDGTYDILRSGALDPNMPAHGGNADLAPFPDWTARYLVHKDPQQRAFVLANGDLSGSWPVHVREPEAGPYSGVGPERMVSLNQRPSLWYDMRAPFDDSKLPDGSSLDFIAGTPMPYIEYTSVCANDPPGAQELADGCVPRAGGHTRLIPDTAHQPSLAYVPYLLTGDRYYAEEMAFWANYSILRTYPADGVRGDGGILADNEVRGYGWALRNIVDAAAYYPGSDISGYLAQKVRANLAWLDGYADVEKLNPNNPFQVLWVGYRPEAGYISLWEQTYLAYAIDRANKQGFAGGLKHRDAITKLQLRLFTSAPDYPRETVISTDTTLSDGTFLPAGTVLTWSAPYLVGVGTTADDSWSGFSFYQSMKDIWEGSSPDPTPVQHPTQGFDRQRDFAGYYGPEARLNLMMRIDSGDTSAQEPYDYLFPFLGLVNSYCSTAYGGSDDVDRPDLTCRSGWALDFYPSAPRISSVTCAPGTYLAAPTDTACTPAPAGYFVSAAGATAATPCPPGTFSAAAGAAACTPAPAGSYVGTSSATAATPCAPGTFSAAAGAASCTPAPAGSYVSLSGATAATLCAPGTFSAATSAIACTPAPAGSYVSLSGATTATPCPVGTSSQIGATSCFAVNTPAGSSPVTVQASPLVTVTFSNVSGAGNTTAVPIDPATAGLVPGGFSLAGLAYDVSTTAAMTPPITVCISTPTISDPALFSALRILHNEGGMLVDRTLLAPDPLAPDFGARRICARVNSLSPFAIGRIGNGLASFVAFSNDMTWLESRTMVVSGDVGANLRRKHRHDDDDDDDGDADDITVRIGEQVTLHQPGSRVVGDTVRLGNKASVYDVVDNFLVNRGRRATILGTVTRPMAIPFLTLPALPSMAPGTTAVEVAKGSTKTLGPGAYGKVHVNTKATLILTGGLYQLLSLDVDQSATVIFRAATEVRIKTELDTDNRAKMVPDPAVTGLTAAQIRFYVAGSDASCKHNGRDAESGDDGGRSVAHIGENNVVAANIYAPNGTIWIKSKTQATGAFVGDDVRIGQNVKLTLDSAFQ